MVYYIFIVGVRLFEGVRLLFQTQRKGCVYSRPEECYYIRGSAFIWGSTVIMNALEFF